MEKSNREFEVESKVEAIEAKVKVLGREAAELRRKREALDLILKIIDMIAKQAEKGKYWIWIDAKMVEWVDKQVEMGKYRSRSHAVEKIIQSKMREEITRAYEI